MSIDRILSSAATMGEDQLPSAAVELAGLLLGQAQRGQSRPERVQAKKLAGMMADSAGKNLTLQMSDQLFRSSNPGRVADQLRYLVARYGVAHYLSWWERKLLAVGTALAGLVPRLVVPRVISRLRREAGTVILPGEPGPLGEYLRRGRTAGSRFNINQLGEAILGEEEAERRFQAYLTLLARPDVEYISVKLSSIFSQINLAAPEAALDGISEKLRRLYRAAMEGEYRSSDGSVRPKFVNLDMEEYQDLHLTTDAFQGVLDEEEFLTHSAGLVLQAYLPDAFVVQRQLTEWALDRVARGGAPIKIRVVKGANLAMEQVEASCHGWEQAPYGSKEEVDANFKRMVEYGCLPEHAKAINLGVGSHNLFDIAYGLLLRARHDVVGQVEFEMLEGMANHQARAVGEAAGGVLFYAPVVKAREFRSAIAYLVRRLDENTAPENFLRDLFGLKVGSEAWATQERAFLRSMRLRDEVSSAPRRFQDRRSEERFDSGDSFSNEPDTDFSLPPNQEWIKRVYKRWEGFEPPPVPLQIGGQYEIGRKIGDGHDPSHPGTVAYNYAMAGPEQVDQALEVAVESGPGWGALGVAGRRRVLLACGRELARRRSDLIGAMVLDGGKATVEADVEVSEAVDFANYYARSLDLDLDGASLEPTGVVVVTPPWNFPLAIPAGGILAALMAGNTVVFKPAREAVLVGWHLADTLWEAGVPKEVLQFLPTADHDTGRSLVTDPRVAAVILTGARSTGRLFLSWRPDLRLLAETSGKNALIVTAMADRDLAIKDLVRSAFGHSGQKCSASSLAVLEAEVYDDPGVRRQLRDATASLVVGSAWNRASVVTPVIHPPGEDLRCALEELHDGESWLLEPKMVDGNPNLWSPGIKLGVRPGSFFHRTECFGPVLGVMRADSFEDALAIANDSEFGLTGGLHTLDDREIEEWIDRVEVGNAYVNRGITGAIVQRQPFGGWKKSGFGTGAKAGGPNYVLSLTSLRDADEPRRLAVPSAAAAEVLEAVEGELDSEDLRRLRVAAGSYAYWWREHFSREHDPSEVLGESNVFRYRPLPEMGVLVANGDDPFDAARTILATRTCGVPLKVGAPSGPHWLKPLAELEGISVTSKFDAPFVADLAPWSRLRILSPAPETLLTAAHDRHIPVLCDPVLSNGRFELRLYLREQAVSRTTHRYGDLIE